MDIKNLILEEKEDEDESNFVRAAVAKNPKNSYYYEELLEKISREEKEKEDEHKKFVSDIIAKNPHCSEELLEVLVNDKNFEVKSIIYQQFHKKLDELEQTTFVQYFDIEAFRTEPISSAIKELYKTLEKAEKDGLVFEPLNLEKENQTESDKPDIGDKNSADDGIDL